MKTIPSSRPHASRQKPRAKNLAIESQPAEIVPNRMYWFAYKFGNVKRFGGRVWEGHGLRRAVRRHKRCGLQPLRCAIVSNRRRSRFWVAQRFERCDKCFVFRIGFSRWGTCLYASREGGRKVCQELILSG